MQMASVAFPTTTALTWHVQMVQVGPRTVPVGRLLGQVQVRTAFPGQRLVSEGCWVDIGAPLTVVPFHVHHRRLAWRPLPNVSTTWLGQRCAVGEIDLWLPIRESPAPRGPFTVLAKFPLSDPPGGRVPVLLGVEFLLTYQASLQVLPPPQGGLLTIP